MTTAASLIQSAFREGNLIPVGKQPTTDEQTEALERLNRFVQGVYGQELGENLVDWLVPAPQRTSGVAANWPQAPYPTDAGGGLYGSPYASDPTLNIWPYPPKNSRIVWGLTDQTVYFPERPDPGSRMAVLDGSGAGDNGQDGDTLILDGNSRLIEDPADNTTKAQVSLTSPIASPGYQWLFRDDLGAWMLVQDMALTDDCPFPSEFDDFWICALAMRLAPRYGKTTAPETNQTAVKMLMKIKARYRQSQVTTYGSQDFPRSLQSYISGRWYW